MLEYFFTKALQGALFVQFCEVIMGWKHVEILHMGLPSTKERVGGGVKVKLSKVEFESSVDTKEGKT